MGWSVVASVALAVVAVAVAFGVVRASRPATRRLVGALPATRRLMGALPATRRLPVVGRTGQSVIVLVAGATVAVALVSVFLEILEGVRENDDLTRFDRPVIEWVASHRTGWMNSLVIALTDIGGRAGLTLLLTVVALAVAYRLRSWRPIVLAVVSGGGGALLVTGIKALVARDRPDPLLRAVTEDGFSFPSGHSASSLVVLCTVAWLVSMAVPDRTVRATVWVAAVPLALAIGLSRIYLGVHYPTDVLAGWVLGTTWLITVALAAHLPGRYLMRREHFGGL
ncbi:phosphatase PAP2 family protein [Cryptosporangium sp. NPDC048952]|uniref:phosphatase PAP2 family protein n=1 Tax=Cryptosporangium sp. NPDC048952 TaxID=3363961 RepID=UPI003720C3BD